ncbi:DUF5993 family protein [Haloglycomyces albus]|uniref:DUF5993 family protein n=1 Tax=Haloglycomyces albus TaxID=526067 RepID=UPI0004AD97C6|nr:DUF5993 family protein [Haloglycomyces albus]
MDTVIMALLLVLCAAAYTARRRGVVLLLWGISLIAMLALFSYHVTDPLGYSW